MSFRVSNNSSQTAVASRACVIATAADLLLACHLLLLQVAEQLREAAKASQVALSAMFDAERAAVEEEKRLAKLKAETALGTK